MYKLDVSVGTSGYYSSLLIVLHIRTFLAAQVQYLGVVVIALVVILSSITMAMPWQHPLMFTTAGSDITDISMQWSLYYHQHCYSKQTSGASNK